MSPADKIEGTGEESSNLSSVTAWGMMQVMENVKPKITVFDLIDLKKSKIAGRPRLNVLPSFCPYCRKMVKAEIRGYLSWCRSCNNRID